MKSHPPVHLRRSDARGFIGLVAGFPGYLAEFGSLVGGGDHLHKLSLGAWVSDRLVQSRRYGIYTSFDHLAGRRRLGRFIGWKMAKAGMSRKELRRPRDLLL